MSAQNSPDLRVHIGALTLDNPVMTASGTFGYGAEFAGLLDLSRLGALVTKGISLEPRAGNPPPRIAECASGMLNAIGLENVGVERFLAEKMPFLRRFGAKTIVNILGNSEEEYAALAARLAGVEGVRALEVNISCPNVRQGGIAFGVDPKMAAAVVRAVKRHARQPVIVKLSPNVTDICLMARAVADAGADAVSLINTLIGMAIDIRTRRPELANRTGGLSGPAIKPVALRMVWQVAQVLQIPVIGVGGIATAEDALEFLLAGATAVQVGTANFTNPGASVAIVEGIAAWLAAQHEPSVQAIIGGLRDV